MITRRNLRKLGSKLAKVPEVMFVALVRMLFFIILGEAMFKETTWGRTLLRCIVPDMVAAVHLFLNHGSLSETIFLAYAGHITVSILTHIITFIWFQLIREGDEEEKTKKKKKVDWQGELLQVVEADEYQPSIRERLTSKLGR